MMRAQWSAYWANASRWNGSIWYRMKQVIAMVAPGREGGLAAKAATPAASRPRNERREAGERMGDKVALARPSWFDYHGTMDDTPDITAVAGLIGDRARATMLSALMAGRSLTATELARAGRVTKQTASSHLSKLVAARLVAVE